MLSIREIAFFENSHVSDFWKYTIIDSMETPFYK
jgi:hypothetical protein